MLAGQHGLDLCHALAVFYLDSHSQVPKLS